jgi:hypothetical protein
LREAIGFEERYEYLLHDRDSIFAKHLDESIERLGVKVLRSPPRSRIAGNHDSPGAVFATSSRRIVRRSSRINLGWTASRIFADACRRVTELLRTTSASIRRRETFVRIFATVRLSSIENYTLLASVTLKDMWNR